MVPAMDGIDEGELRELLQAMVRCPSVTGDEAGVARLCADWLVRRGVPAQLVEAEPGRPNVIAQLGPGAGRTLVLNGHIDVVPAGDGWTQDPWGGEIVDGRLYGRGSADMKAGCACAMAAMVAAARTVDEPVGRVILTLVIDEEDAGRGTRHTIAEGLRADWALVCEPTELKPVRAAKGDCYIEVRVSGKAAHAGAPDLGVNAIHGAAEVIRRVQAHDVELRRRTHAVVTPPCIGAGVITGGLTVAAVAPECTIWFDRRVVPGETGEDALRELHRVLHAEPIQPDGVVVEEWLRMEMPAMETPPGHPLLDALCAAALEAGAPPAEPGGWTAACDGGFLARDAELPVVIFGPGSVTEAHRPDESVPAADLPVAAATYALLARRVLTGAL
jgi:acetylornithine deacetylase